MTVLLMTAAGIFAGYLMGRAHAWYRQEQEKREALLRETLG